MVFFGTLPDAQADPQQVRGHQPAAHHRGAFSGLAAVGYHETGEHPEAAGSVSGFRDRPQPLDCADGLGPILMMSLLAALLFIALATPVAAENVCIVCHKSDAMKPEYRVVYKEWNESWHGQNNVSCNDCHGGDTQDVANAMSPQRGFLGKPKPCGHSTILRQMPYRHPEGLS